MPNSDPSLSNGNPIIKTSDPSDELTHITQEMYKKNSELNDRNKTLALLRKIDSIVLSKVTDLKLIAQQVTDLLVEEEFQLAGLLVSKKTILFPLAVSSSDKSVLEKYGQDRLLIPPISMLEKDGFLLTAVMEKKTHTTSSLNDVFKYHISEKESGEIQKKLGIKTVIIYPLVIRSEAIGVLVIGISDEQKDISPDKKALIDRLAGVVGIALDNSLLYQSIQEANLRLEQLDKLKDEFVSLASHELRTPMTVIKSYLWMFLHKKGQDLNEKERSYLERAYQSTERLIKLVNDMLNVSRIESGRLKLEMQDLDIVKLVDTVVNELVPRAQELGLKLSLKKPESPVKTLNGDTDRIEQILINFIGNSLKFTPPGGSITIGLFAREKDVLISITDTGRGIKKEDIHKLFQKFGMIGSAYLQKNQNQGSGLGLYLSKSLIELHGGRVRVESGGENKGSTFSFTLPYNEDKPHQEAEVLPATSANSVAPSVPAPVAGGGSAASGFK